MSKKQVITSAALLANVTIPGTEQETTATTSQAVEAAANSTTQKTEPNTKDGPSNLFISVKTFNAEGKTVGERIVDMYHFGTRNWLQSHHWWAMHNGHCVETNVATDTEVTGYLASAKEALAAKFNKAA